MYFVYIIKSQKNLSCYTGITTNLKKRLLEHNNGLSVYSSSKRPFKLNWYCVFNDKKKALDFEKYLKSSSDIAFRNKRFL